MPDIDQIAAMADVIVNGYAFTISGENVRVLCLDHPLSAAVLTLQGEVLETTMDDIELAIVREYLQRSTKYLAA